MGSPSLAELHERQELLLVDVPISILVEQHQDGGYGRINCRNTTAMCNQIQLQGRKHIEKPMPQILFTEKPNFLYIQLPKATVAIRQKVRSVKLLQIFLSEDAQNPIHGFPHPLNLGIPHATCLDAPLATSLRRVSSFQILQGSELANWRACAWA